MSNYKWDGKLTFEIPNIPGEVTVEIHDSVFALFRPEVSNGMMTVRCGPIEQDSAVRPRKIFVRRYQDGIPENAELIEALSGYIFKRVRFFLEKTDSPILNCNR